MSLPIVWPAPSFATDPRIVDRITTPIDRDEVRRYLGYPKGAVGNPRVQATLEHWIAEAAARAEPKAIYQVFPVAQVDKRHVAVVTARGPAEFRGAIGEFLGPVEWLALFVSTAGPGVERLASELMAEGDHLGGLIVNAVGAERAEAAEAAVIAELTEQATPAGMVLTLPYSPGYCGMAITEQRTLFTAIDATSIGVRLSPDCMMVPLKSVSGLIGLGPDGVLAARVSPCDRCTMHTCAMRR
ncbi:MAG: vitamin B12 dependent-methionine synthase activation domain-containing protein [Gemmataceae bacterium]